MANGVELNKSQTLVNKIYISWLFPNLFAPVLIIMETFSTISLYFRCRFVGLQFLMSAVNISVVYAFLYPPPISPPIVFSPVMHSHIVATPPSPVPSQLPPENGRQSRVQWRIFHHHASVSDAAASVSLTMFPAARVCVCICMNEYTTHYIRVHIYMELCFSGICTLAAYLSCFWHLLNGNRKRLSDQLGAHQRKWMKYQT